MDLNKLQGRCPQNCSSQDPSPARAISHHMSYSTSPLHNYTRDYALPTQLITLISFYLSKNGLTFLFLYLIILKMKIVPEQNDVIVTLISREKFMWYYTRGQHSRVENKGRPHQPSKEIILLLLNNNKKKNKKKKRKKKH